MAATQSLGPSYSKKSLAVSALPEQGTKATYLTSGAASRPIMSATFAAVAAPPGEHLLGGASPATTAAA